MSKRKRTGKTPRTRSGSAKPTRQERRQERRNGTKARRTGETSLDSATASSPTTDMRQVGAVREPPPRGNASASPLTSYVRQAALGLLVVVSYLPAMLWGNFIWDDNILTGAEPVQNISGLWQIWFAPSTIDGEGHYWPLVYTTFWLEHKLWGFDPTGYHVVNVLLHLANTLLVWYLMRRLGVPGDWIVAAVFAVHPLHVESVAWIIERKDVLSGLFYLAAVLMWLRFVEQPRRAWYACSLALYVAGLLSKSIVVTLPAALLIWHWWQQGRVTSTDLLRLVPFFAVGLIITIGDLSFYRSIETVAFDYSLLERTLIASRSLWFYAAKLLWPTNLAIFYPLWDIRVGDPLAWGYLIAAISVAVVLWHFRARLGRGPLAGALFFAVTLSPVLGFVDYGYMRYAFVADRFQYLAGIGVMAVVIGAAAYGVRRLSGLWQQGVLVVAGLVVVVLGLLTWRQANLYRDEETYYRHIVAHNPQARDAHFGLGNALYEQGRYEEALAAARVAVEQRPDFFKTHSNLGAALHALGRFAEAETHLRRAIALNPQARDAHLNLGSVLYNQGQYEEALDAVRVAVEQDPDFFEAHINLWGILDVLGRAAEAEIHLRRAIELDPQNAQLILGNVLLEQQRYDEALTLFQRFVAIDPSDAVAHDNMGVVLFHLGRSAEALHSFDRALSIDPTLETARANREAVLKAMEEIQ